MIAVAVVLASPLLSIAGCALAWRFPNGREFIVDLMSTEDARATNLAAVRASRAARTHERW